MLLLLSQKKNLMAFKTWENPYCFREFSTVYFDSNAKWWKYVEVY